MTPGPGGGRIGITRRFLDELARIGGPRFPHIRAELTGEAEVRRLERRVRRLYQLIALDITIILVLVGLAVLLLLDPLAGP
jgi:hypothetical protein